MSDKWDFVPEWQLNAERTGIVGELSTEGEGLGDHFDYSNVSIERAREISAEVRALGDKYERDGPAVLGWALQWMADDIDKAVAMATKEAK